jgi:hypothetical protein
MKTILIAGLAVVLPALAQSPDDLISQISQYKDRVTYFPRVSLIGQGTAVKNAPYSADAITESTQVLGDGNSIEHKTTQKLYRDNDGRERREESVLAVGALPQADMPRMITISDPIENISYTLDAQQRTARRNTGVGVLLGLTLEDVRNTATITGALNLLQGAAGRGRGQTPGGTETVKEDLGSRNVEGVIAHGTRITTTIPAGEIGNRLPIKVVDEVWHSAELQMDVTTTHSDPRTGEIVYKLTNITRANPPRALFEPPADYTVTGPAASSGGGRGAAPSVKK